MSLRGRHGTGGTEGGRIRRGQTGRPQEPEYRVCEQGGARTGGGLPTPLPHPPSLPGLSSVSSPSELSDGTVSVTSAYSSAPDGSPPPLPASEIMMEEMVPGQLSSGAPEAPLFLMDCEATNPKGPPASPPALQPAPDDGAAPEDTDSLRAVDVIPVLPMEMGHGELQVGWVGCRAGGRPD